MRYSSCCPGIGILGGIFPQVYGSPRHPQYPLSGSAFVMYAVVQTIVLPPVSQRLLIRHPVLKASYFRRHVESLTRQLASGSPPRPSTKLYRHIKLHVHREKLSTNLLTIYNQKKLTPKGCRSLCKMLKQITTSTSGHRQ